MSLFSVLVDIAARTASLETGLNRANDHLEHFGEQAREVGEKVKGALEFAGVAFALGEIIHKFDEFVEHAVNIEHASQKTGLAVEQFSHLEFAAKQAGVGTELLTTGLEKLAKNAEAAASGSGKQAEAFAAIGVSVKDSTGHLRPMNDLLLQVADKFASYKDSAEKTALAQALFGKAGAELIPLLNEGSKGIAEYSKRHDELGGTLTEKTIKAAAEFHHKMNEVHDAVTGVWQSVAAELLPSLTSLADSFTKGAEGARKFDVAARTIAAGIKFLETGFLALAGTLDTIGHAWGAMFATMDAAVHGRFREALTIMKEGFSDIGKNVSDTVRAISDVWSEGAQSLEETSKDAGEKMAAPIIAKAFDIQEALAEVFAEIEKVTRSNFDGGKSVDLGNAAAKEAGHEIDKLASNWLKAREAGREMYNQMTAFADQAARNMQTTFANFLFDPFHKGIKGMLVGFIDIIRHMIAEAMAAKILEKLFGTGLTSKGGGSGLGGMLSGLLIGGVGGGAPAGGAASGASGGSGAFPHAAGGRPTIGRPNLVGENGPELFIPDSGGTIIPNGGGMGGNLHFSPVYNINAPNGDAQLRAALPGLLAQAAAKSKRDVIDAFQRGGYPSPRGA